MANKRHHTLAQIEEAEEILAKITQNNENDDLPF